jgi:AraC-like DNA-binding protein
MAEPYERYVLWFSQEFIDLFAQTLEAGSEKISYSTLLRTGDTKWELLGGYFRRGVWEAEHQAPGWQAAIIGNTITLLTLMGRGIRERTASVLTAEKPDLLNEVMNYIELHLNEKITLEETAKHFYVSVSTITQLFRQKMGTSFYRCVTQRRLIAAKVRIGNGESLEDVSHAVGFAVKFLPGDFAAERIIAGRLHQRIVSPSQVPVFKFLRIDFNKRDVVGIEPGVLFKYLCNGHDKSHLSLF